MITALTVFNSLNPIIAELFCLLKLNNREHPKGRKPALTNIDAVTCAVLKQKQNVATKKSLYEMVEPPCTYKTFVESINRVGIYLAQIIALIMKQFRSQAHLIKFTDATDIPVCLLKNSKHHKTMKDLATKSKTGKGYYVGLKAHLSADLEGRVLAFKLSSANGNDRKIFKDMNRALRGVFIADAGYVGDDFTKDFYVENERIVITATRSNMRKVATQEQIALLNLRMKVETHFRMLKVVYGMITSLPRSVTGYLTHYVSAVTAHLIVSVTKIPQQVSSPVLS
jgi:Transposase DDE domain